MGTIMVEPLPPPLDLAVLFLSQGAGFVRFLLPFAEQEMIENLKTEISAIKRWASSNPLIRKVWIFGSCIRVNPHEADDFDVAVEIEKKKGDVTKEVTWFGESRRWKNELNALMKFGEKDYKKSFKLHLEWYDTDGNKTPRIRKGIQAGSHLIYSKGEDNYKNQTTEGRFIKPP